MSNYPEHDKLKALAGANQTVGDFIGWLEEQGLELARWNEAGTYCLPANKPREELLAEFFGINRSALEAEKLAMLGSLREPRLSEPA